MNTEMQLYCTLLPSMEHFTRFATDPRMSGIRLNSPMLTEAELQQEFDLLAGVPATAEMFFDVKGRQLRVLGVENIDDHHLEVVINHPISAAHDSLVLFKAGGDPVLLDRVADDGTRLIFQGGPEWTVKPGESFHVMDDSFRQHGDLFNEWEPRRVEMARAAGFSRFLLSYTESMRDVDQFQELVGPGAEIWLKIENRKGLHFVQDQFVKRDNLTLVAARGDLFVELQPKHEILQALQMIIARDPQAVAGSRILLSVINDLSPSCADLSELAWLHDIGYRRYMLCDELCLAEDMLARAVNVFEGFADGYSPSPLPAPLVNKPLTNRPHWSWRRRPVTRGKR